MKQELIQKVKDKLQQKGYKFTGPRLAILQYLAQKSGHPDMQEINEDMKVLHPGIGMATIYRNLDLFVEMGFVRSLTLKNNPVRYELPSAHHHHLICNECNDVIEFETCNFHQVARGIEEATRFAITGHNLEAYGFCERCSPGF